MIMVPWPSTEDWPPVVLTPFNLTNFEVHKSEKYWMPMDCKGENSSKMLVPMIRKLHYRWTLHRIRVIFLGLPLLLLLLLLLVLLLAGFGPPLITAIHWMAYRRHRGIIHVRRPFDVAIFSWWCHSIFFAASFHSRDELQSWLVTDKMKRAISKSSLGYMTPSVISLSVVKKHSREQIVIRQHIKGNNLLLHVNVKRH